MLFKALAVFALRQINLTKVCFFSSWITRLFVIYYFFVFFEIAFEYL